MSNVGWHPDPGGSGQFRYWDGQHWSAQTSPVPGGPAPTTAGTGQPSQGRGRRWLVPLLVLVAAVVIWAGVGAFNRAGLVEQVNTSTPTTTGWDETSTPSSPPPTPTPSSPGPSNATTVNCPFRVSAAGEKHDGKILRGGGLTAQRPAGFEDYATGRFWLADTQSVMKPIPDSTWIHSVNVGRVPVEYRWKTPEVAAKALMDCWASSGRYPGFESRTTVNTEAVSIDGRSGYWVRTDIRVKHPTVRGGRVDIVVVDTGNPKGFSAFISAVHIGDDEVQQLVDQSRTSMRVTD